MTRRSSTRHGGPVGVALVMAVAASTTLLASPAGARPTQQVPIGARALGMGGAFTAIADDATALFWNPAGLPFIQHQEIAGGHANLFGSDINDNFAAFVLPLSPRRAAAIDWYASGFEDSELDFNENRIDFSFGQRVAPFLSLGATAKFLSRSTDLDGTTVRRGNGFGFDLGVLATPIERFRAALVCQDVTNTSLNYSGDQGTAVAFPRNFRGGLSYGIRRNLAVAFDADDRWHVGTEYRPLDLFSLRAGLQDDWEGPDDMSWSAGAGIQVGVLRFDYALVDHPTLGSTNHFGVSLGFNFNPAQIRIEKVEARDIYASLYRTYAQEPIGTLQIRNLDDQPITATIGVFVPQLMSAPHTQDVVLRPGVTQAVPITAVLPSRIMSDRGDKPVEVEVTATYQSRRLPRTERRTGRCVAYGPGAIDWGNGVAQAAAFVTPRDATVDALAREATLIANHMEETHATIRNVAHAAAIFDAVGALGVVYVPDPNNPYATVSETPRAVDTISYPRETLARRTGDCDDTSVLLASLLGNVGIASQLVDVPGHLFLLVDTGIHVRNQLAMGLDESRYVVTEDEVWVPLETTALGKGFAEAWRLGADSYAAWDGRGSLSRVDLATASAKYKPAELSGAPPALPALDSSQLGARLKADLEMVQRWREEFFAQRYGEARAGVEATPQALSDLAHVYFLSGDLTEAQRTLERARAKDPASPQIANNLANVAAAQGDFAHAIALYDEAVRRDPSDAGVWLNLGLARYVSGDSLGADAPLAEGVKRSGGYADACRLLGLTPGVEATREGAQRMSAEEARALLRDALRKVPRPSGPVQGTAASSKGSTGAARSPQEPDVALRIGGGRSLESGGAVELQDLLYWRTQ